MRGIFISRILMHNITPSLHQNLTHVQMPLPRRIEQRRLTCYLINMIDINYNINPNFTFPLNHLMNNINPILFRHIKQRRLSINIFLIQRQPITQQQVQTLLLPLTTDIKQHRLLVVVFEMRICRMLQQQFHYLIRLLMVDQYCRHVQGRLPRLCLQSVDYRRAELLYVTLDLVNSAKLTQDITNILLR